MAKIAENIVSAVSGISRRVRTPVCHSGHSRNSIQVHDDRTALLNASARAVQEFDHVEFRRFSGGTPTPLREADVADISAELSARC
jgi:hypothetical protein